MMDQELKELVTSLAVAQRETDRQLKETSRETQRFGIIAAVDIYPEMEKKDA